MSFEPERLERLEAEDVADDGRGDVGDRAGLEQVEVVGDAGEVLRLVAGPRTGARDRIHPVALAPVVVGGGQAIRPHHGPGCSRRFAGHRCRGFHRIDARLGRDAEAADQIGVPGLIVRAPVPHPLVLQNAGLVAFGAPHLERLGHRVLRHVMWRNVFRHDDARIDISIKLEFLIFSISKSLFRCIAWRAAAHRHVRVLRVVHETASRSPSEGRAQAIRAGSRPECIAPVPARFRIDIMNYLCNLSELLSTSYSRTDIPSPIRLHGATARGPGWNGRSCSS